MWRIIYFLVISQLADAADLRIYNDSLDTYDVTSLDNASEILKSSHYNSSCSNLIYTFGYRGKADGRSVNTTLSAMLSLKKRTCANVFLLDWTKETSSTGLLGEIGIKVEYVIKVLYQAVAVGRKFGAALLNMAKKGFFLTKTHLIGHSLGAQLYAQTGLYINDHWNGTMIDRITGLDPAGPLFQGPLSLYKLDKTCASFVVSIHSDAGGYGINESLAHVDVWPNFNNFIKGTKKEHVQPGCAVGDFKFMSSDDLCSHDRSWQLMAEILTMTNTLLASKAVNQYAWNAGATTTVIELDNIDRNARGDFFLVTNSTSPFGKGSDGLHL